MPSNVDAVGALTTIALAVCGFLVVASLTYLGSIRAAGRLEALGMQYRGSLRASSELAELLDDMGPVTKLIGRVADDGHRWTASVATLGVVIGVVALGIVTGSYILAYLMLVLVVLVPFGIARIVDMFLVARVRRVEAALPDAISIMASSIGAGLTLQAALGAVAANMKGPIATEARIASNNIAAGASAADALAMMVRRNRIIVRSWGRRDKLRERSRVVESEFLGMFVAVARVHLSHGGNLSEALKHLGEALSRVLLAEGEIRAKTAGTRHEIKLATIVPFVCLPLGYLIAPDIFSRLFTTTAGHLLLILSASLWSVGAYKVRQISNTKV